MEDTRPYWKVIVSLAFSLIGTILFIVIGIKLLWFFMPFVIGWFIAFIANPLVCWLEKRLKIVKKLGSAIIIIAVLAGVVSALYFGISKLADEVGSLITNFPQMYSELEKGMKDIGESFQGVFRLLPEGIQTGWNAVVANLDNTMGNLIGKISEPTVEAAGNLAKSIPSILVSTIVTIVAAYFFIAERDEVIVWFKKITPKPIQQRMTLVIDNLKYAVGGYFKAQFKIMGVIYVILLIGLLILRVDFAWLIAFGIAFLDMLPVFGTGTVLCPWAVIKLFTGDYKMAVGMIVLYVVSLVVHQIVQPKLIGDSVGLDPFASLLFMFIGYRVGSVVGMILAIPVGMILINLYEAGAFDTLVWCVREVVNDFNNFRKVGGEKK